MFKDWAIENSPHMMLATEKCMLGNLMNAEVEESRSVSSKRKLGRGMGQSVSCISPEQS